MTDRPAAAPGGPAPHARRGARPAGVVAGAFALLRALGGAGGPAGVTALASAAGVPKATAHRLLEQLAAEGVVVRRDRRWALGPGLQELARAGRRPGVLAAAARPRLAALARATGATLFLHHAADHAADPAPGHPSDQALEAVCRAYGAQVGRVLLAAEQRLAAEHPASAIWRALGSGHLAAEYREVRPECNCIALPFPLPEGGVAVLSLARPAERELESLKRPLERAASAIVADLRRAAG